MSIGQNKTLMIGGGLLFLLMLACGYFLWTFHGQNKSAASDLETKQTTLNGLVGKKAIAPKDGKEGKAPTPSPTADNVAELDRQIEAATAYYTNYVETLFKDLPPQRKAEPSDFQLEIETTVNEARAFAKKSEVELGEPEAAAANLLGGFQGAAPVQPGAEPAAEEEEVFFMDFDKYTKEGERPERSHIPRLSRQLAILDDLTRLLVENGADRIVAVERDKFDLAEQEANRGGLLNFNPFGAGAAAEEEEEEIAYENEVFKLRFQADEASAFLALGAINRLPYPASISQLHLKNQHETMIPFVEAQAGVAGVIPGAGIPGLDGAPAAAAKKDMADLILSAGREPVEVHVEIYISTPPELEEEEEDDSPLGF